LVFMNINMRMEKIVRIKTNCWFVLLALVVFLSCTENGERWFEWEASDEGVIITGYTGRGGNIRIPSQIQEMPVVGIGREAFTGRNWSEEEDVGIVFSGEARHRLTGVIIPDSVRFIGKLAFGGNQLTSINIPDSVTSIGDWAFVENQLSDIIIPSGIVSIGDGVFARNRFTEIVIPETVVSIGDGAFGGNQLSSIVIPNGVVSIGALAFGWNNIVELSIPDSVVSVGQMAFAANRLTTVTIPDNDISIGDWAFVANQLTGIPAAGRQVARTPEQDRQQEDWEQNHPQYDAATDFRWDISEDGSSVAILSYIGENRNVRIPSEIFGMSVVEIIGGAFSSRPISEVTIPNSVTHIGARAFFQSGLTWVNLGDNVVYIGHQAFALNNIFRIEIPNSVRVISSSAFFSNNLVNVTIPDGVISIGNAAFGGNQLSGVTIPGSIIHLGSGIFIGSDLSHITIGNDIEIREANGFPSRVVRLYNEQGRQAGIFTRTGNRMTAFGGTWNFRPQESTMSENE